MRKLRVLAITEASYLHSGYAVYWHYILKELYKSGKYDLAEFATFVDPINNKLDSIEWKCYPNIPPDMSVDDFREWSKNPMNNFGQFMFNEVALDFQPDVVLHAGDWWMQKYVNESPYRRHFKYIWLAPVDAEPQNMEWIEDMANCDGVLTYTDWGKETVEKQAPKVKVYASAPSSVQDFFVPLDKKAIKEHFNIRPDVKFIGTVMRNQRRKLFPQLFECFRRFLDETGYTDTYLYCHTSYPDGSWNFPELIQRYNVADKVFFTYNCRNPQCLFVFPCLYSDVATCPKCRKIGAMMPSTMFGVHPQQLAYIYNLFDLYVQFSNSEGLGMPMVEASGCGVPIIATDYSAMSDVVRKVGGEPLNVKTFTIEMETGCKRAIPDSDHFVELLKTHFKKPEMLRNIAGIKARNMFLRNYKWEESGKRWSELIDLVGTTTDDWFTPAHSHIPAALTNQAEVMTNTEYARWLIKDVAGLAHKIGSYTEMQLIRDLNYGQSTGIFNNTNYFNDSSLFNDNKTEQFTRAKAYDIFKNIGDINLMMEKQRVERLLS